MIKPKVPSLQIFNSSLKELPKLINSIFTEIWLLLGLMSFRDFIIISNTSQSAYSNIIILILNFLIILATLSVQISWMEKVIKKEKFIFKFDNRLLLMIGHSILYSIICFCIVGIPITILIFLTGVNFFSPNIAAILLICWIFIGFSFAFRFLLVFPAISVSNPKTRYIRSFRLTEGYHFQLSFLLMPFYLLIYFASGIVSFIAIKIGFVGIGSYMFTMLVIDIVTILATLLSAEILSRLFVFFHLPKEINKYIN